MVIASMATRSYDIIALRSPNSAGVIQYKYQKWVLSNLNTYHYHWIVDTQSQGLYGVSCGTRAATVVKNIAIVVDIKQYMYVNINKL